MPHFDYRALPGVSTLSCSRRQHCALTTPVMSWGLTERKKRLSVVWEGAG